MRRTTILILSLISLISWNGQAQNKYSEHDKALLRNFFRQPSAIKGKWNGERIGLVSADTINWNTDEAWIAKISSPNDSTPISGDKVLRWNNETIKQLVEIQFSIKSLAGNLNVSNCEALKLIDCNRNQIKTLNASGCKKLTELDCGWNLLAELNISGCNSLLELYCYLNSLPNINISDCKNITLISCWSNLLSTLDVSSNTSLVNLSCGRNLLTSIDVSKNIALKTYSCSENNITDIDVSKCSELVTLMCYKNKLTQLSTSDCTKLVELECNNNQLKLSTLPLRTDKIKSYYCDPQDTIYNDNIPSESIIDLSSEYLNGMTIYKWYDISNGSEVELTSDIINNNNGTFQLSKTLNSKKLRCKMTNPNYKNNFKSALITIVRDYKVAGNPTGITKLSSKSAVIFPNPVENELCISGEDNIIGITIQDMNGRVIYQNNKLNTSTFTLSIAGWGKGVYLVNVKNEQTTQVFKLIKK